MIKTKITFDIEDEAYFNRLKTYLSLNYSDVIVIDDNHYDYVISDKQRINDQYIIIGNHQFDIYKYQKASKIGSLIINAATKNMEMTVEDQKENTARIIVITSAAGGAGKTRVSQNLCRRLAMKKNKVLYISLDSSSAMDGIFSDENENDLSKLLYYLSLNRDVNKSVEAIKGYDSINDVYFIRCIYPSMDGLFDIDTMCHLLKGLKNNTVYQYIIFDLPSFLISANIELMNQAFVTLVIHRYESEREKIHTKYLMEKVTGKIKTVPYNQDIEQIMEAATGNDDE